MSPEKGIIIFEHVFPVMTQSYVFLLLNVQIFLVIVRVTMVPTLRPPEIQN